MSTTEHVSRACAASMYLNRGLQPIPVPAGLKGPRHEGWNREAIDHDQIPTRFAGKGNIGILLGSASGGLIDIDLDCPEALELADRFLPHTTATTGRCSTPRSHRWYIAHGMTTRPFRDPVTNEMIVEIRSTGVQTLVGPSIHPETGERYDMLEGDPSVVDPAELSACVAKLFDCVMARRYPEGVPATAATRPLMDPTATQRPRVATYRDDTRVLERARKYLAKMPEAIAGLGGHDSTFAAATCMVHGFGLEPDIAFDLLRQEYNPRCQPPWSERELRHKIDDAATKSHELPYGWLRDAPSRLSSCAITEFRQSSRDSAVRVQDADAPESHEAGDIDTAGPIDPGPFPQHVLEVPGFIGQVVEHNLRTAIRAQPILALAGAITLLGTLAGRKVRDELDNRTNIYAICVAGSGAGKDHARKLNREILIKSGQASLEPCEDLASDSGLNTVVESSPACIIQLDEFGRFLKTASDSRRSTHLYAITTQLIRLYSSANTTYLGKAYSDPANRRVIVQPCLSILGTTVPSHFLEALTPTNLIDGLLGRMLVFESTTLPCRHRQARKELPQSIVDVARYWREVRAVTDGASGQPQPMTVPTDPEGEATFESFNAEIDPLLAGEGEVAAVWARAEENARRLALIHACSADHQNPRITASAASWACDLVRHTVRRLLFLANRWVSETPFQGRCKRVLRIIEDAGGRTQRSNLCRKTQFMSTRELDEVMESLVAAGQIEEQTIKTKGRSKGVYIRL